MLNSTGMRSTRSMRKRAGFTLVELVVVIMILGILAGVAAPKFINTSQEASENSAKQTLSVVRNAIEMYIAQNNGTKPTVAGIAGELAPYIRGSFPACPVGANAGSAAVGAGLTIGGTEGWRYDTTTNAFIINSAATDSNTVAYNTY